MAGKVGGVVDELEALHWVRYTSSTFLERLLEQTNQKTHLERHMTLTLSRQLRTARLRLQGMALWLSRVDDSY